MNETKRQIIESLLSEGKNPEQIAEEVGCTVRYAYEIKALNEQPKSDEPTVKNHLASIQESLKTLSSKVDDMQRSENIKDAIVLCPGCSTFFLIQDGQVCEECGVLLCGDEGCLKDHQEEGIIEDSQCKDYQKKIASI